MVFIQNFKLHNAISSLIICEDSIMTIYLSIFSHIEINSSLIIFNNTKDHNNSILQIENTIFLNNINLRIDESINFIHIAGKNTQINFNKVNMSSIKLFLNILYIDSQYGKFFLNSSIFFENQPIRSILSINSLIMVNITSNKFQYTNRENDTGFFQGGGNIFLSNCQMRYIENLEISYSFSSKTTFGIKITDFDRNSIDEKPYVFHLMNIFF